VLQVLFGKFGGMVTNAAKKRCWEELAGEVGAVSRVKRSGEKVRKKWMYMKSDAKGCEVMRRKDLKATGGGQRVGEGSVSDNKERILGLIGRVCTEGISGGCDTADVQLLPEMSSGLI